MHPARVDEAFRGILLRVEVEHWEDPSRIREVVRHPGAAAVVALTGDGGVVLVRQLREVLRTDLLEIPAGLYDVAGEGPEATAARELREETGYLARSLARLGRIHSSPGFTDEAVDMFLAEAEPSGEAAEEGIEVVTMPLDEAVDRVLTGELTDAKTVAGLLLAARRV